MTQWIFVIIAIIGIIYNTLVTHIVLKNDVKHLGEKVEGNSKRLDKLIFHFLPDK